MPTSPLCAVAGALFTVGGVCYCWCPLYRCVLLLMPSPCYVLLLMPTLSLCAVADAHFIVVSCFWCSLYRCLLLLMPTLTLCAVADAHLTVVGCCWCPLYHCVLLLVFPPPPPCPPFTSFLYQHSQSVDVSRTQGSGAPEIFFFWGGVRTYVCMHRPPQLLGLPQNNPYWYRVPFKIVAKAISESDVMCRTNCCHFDSFKRCFRIRIPNCYYGSGSKKNNLEKPWFPQFCRVLMLWLVIIEDWCKCTYRM